MIKRILISVIILGAIVFAVIWVLSGGTQNIKAAVNHYRNPFKYHSLIDYFFQIGSTTGEAAILPGTPSSLPTIDLTTPPAATSASELPPNSGTAPSGYGSPAQ